jgi:hypothetical protein
MVFGAYPSPLDHGPGAGEGNIFDTWAARNACKPHSIRVILLHRGCFLLGIRTSTHYRAGVDG